MMFSKNKAIRFMLLLAMGAISMGSQAQNSKDSLMKLVTQEVCAELSNKNFTGKSMDELQTEMGLAFMPVLMKHKDALEKEMGGSMNDQAGMEKMAQEIGMRLFTDCPNFLKVMGSVDMNAMSKPTKVPPVMSETSIKGTLVKVVPGELTHLLVKDSKGKLVKIWWMDYFDGSDDMADNPQKMVNKKATVTYSEKEVYSATLKDYVKIKVATSVRFVD